MEFLPIVLSLSVVAAIVVGFRGLMGRTGPPLDASDAPWFALGALVMLASDFAQAEPASAWSPVVDLGSFAVGASLLAVGKPADWLAMKVRAKTLKGKLAVYAESWPRHVGGLILGIHFAQVFFTNDVAPFSTNHIQFPWVG